MPADAGQYEHSSIVSTVIHKLFKPKEGFPEPDFLTKRDAWAATFEDVFSLDTPRDDCPTSLPDVPSHRRLYSETLPPQDGNMPLSDLQLDILAICAGASGDSSSSLRNRFDGWNELRGAQFCEEAMKIALSD
jgi:phospholipase C